LNERNGSDACDALTACMQSKSLKNLYEKSYVGDTNTTYCHQLTICFRASNLLRDTVMQIMKSNYGFGLKPLNFSF